MKKLTILALKKKIFLRDLLSRMKNMPDDKTDANLISEIIINSEYIDYDPNDMSMENFNNIYDELGKFYKKIKNTEFEILLEKHIFEGKLLGKLATGFKLVFYFDFRGETHHLIFSTYNKTFFHIYALKDKNKPISRTNKLIYNCVLNATKKKLNKSKFFELILKYNEGPEDMFMEENKDIEYEERERMWEEHAYTDNKGVNQFELYKQGKFK